MYIRKIKRQRSKNSKIFYQYSLAQTYRADNKVKQRNILYLGSSELMEDHTNRKIVLSILKAKIFKTEELFPISPPKDLEQLALSLFEKYLVKYGQDDTGNKVSIPPAPKKAEFHNIDIKGLEICDVKTFGAGHLTSQVLEKLNLKNCFKEIGFNEKQINKALLSVAARAIFSSSEYKTAQYLETNSDLKRQFNIEQKITHKQLYSMADKLYEHKDKTDTFLYKQITDIFDLDDKLIIFDISNTYFETRKQNSKIAKYGRGKEKRTDCPLVVFTGVINAEGFMRHTKIYQGNKADATTLEDMIADLEKHSPTNVKETIVIDAGIATEDNLKTIDKKGYKYVCVSRKRLKDYNEMDVKKTITQLTDRNKNKVELAIFKPKGYTDTWMYVQSEAKRTKETSMNDKLKQRFEEDLEIVKKALSTKGGTKQINKVWERIGRAKQKHNRVSSNYIITIEEDKQTATELTWTIKKQKVREDKTKGVYFIRTNYSNSSEEELWKIYNTIRGVESTFGCLKTDLNIRPVHHQKDQGIESHIYLTILAYQLVNTIRHMLKSKEIKDSWTNIVRIMNTQTIQTIVLPTDKKNIQLSKPSNPIEEVQAIYRATNCKQTQMPIKKYVVYH